MIQNSTLKFLKELRKNNNKPWFDAHRPAYEAAKKDFIQFIHAVIDGHGKKDTDIRLLTAKECMFRINRDVRFSKDKSPYKTNFGASINKGGRKAFNYAGYYFHLEPGQSFAGGGLYMPMPDDLRKLRQEIDYNFDAFKKIIGSRKFKTAYGDLYKGEEFSLSRVPKGYEADNPAADYLKLKSYIATVEIPDVMLTSKSLVKTVINHFSTLKTLNDFINTAISD